ncbi:MAG: alpha/beta hydrolase [Jatrophihabitans sp.]
MALTGWFVVVVAAVLCVGSIAAVLGWWNRIGPSGWPRQLGRGGLVLGAQLAAVLLVAVLMNDAGSFYTSWSQLWESPAKPRSVQAQHGARDAQLRGKLREAQRTGHGIVVSLTVPGTTSRVSSHQALVYLPAAYGDPRYPDRQFSVVELLHGYPGAPQTWTKAMSIAAVMDREVQAGRAMPMILVMPTQSVAGVRDTECVNISAGPQVDTYLTADVRRAVSANFRSMPGPDGWALMGYSTGGFCATNLLMRHPDLYTAGASIAGYFQPPHDHSTGDLFGRDPTARNLNNPVWRLLNLPIPAVSLLLVSTSEDHPAARAQRVLLAAVQRPMRVETIQVRHGGHNFEVWRPEEPVCLDWLSRHLIAPLAPGPSLDGKTPHPTGTH